MGELANQRQEKFCRLVVLEGLPASRAYVEAGYKAKNPKVAEVSGSRLLRVARVQSRMREFRAQINNEMELQRVQKAVKETIDIDWWRNTVIDRAKVCWDKGDTSVAQRYDEMLAKHLGAYDADNRQKRSQINALINIGTSEREAIDVYSEIIKDG